MFGNINNSAWEMRSINISKQGFQFANAKYLKGNLENIDYLPNETFDDIILKYIEVNILHPLKMVMEEVVDYGWILF